MEPITTDSILAWFKEITEQKKVVDAHTLVNTALKLNFLIGDEHDKLMDLQQAVAKKKVEFISIGEPVARAKAKVEATDEYKAFCRQKAKIDQVNETIRLAKIMAKLKEEEFKNY